MIELLYWQLSMCIYVYGGHKVNSRKMSMNLNFCTCSYTCTKPVYHKQTRHETTKIYTCSRKDILGHVNGFQDNSRSIILLIGPVTPSQYPLTNIFALCAVYIKVTKMYEDVLKEKENLGVKLAQGEEEKKKLFRENELLGRKVSENAKVKHFVSYQSEYW